MMNTTKGTITGRKFFFMMLGAFSIIISVNLTLAYQAIATFPGLEVKNSYVTSQSFDRRQKAQLALNWDVAARIDRGNLRLSIRRDGGPVQAKIHSAILGRATSVADDQFPAFTFDGADYVAPVDLSSGNWNLRLIAFADDGTKFQQRIIVDVQP